MKKTIIALIIITLLFVMSACGKNPQETLPDQQSDVVSDTVEDGTADESDTTASPSGTKEDTTYNFDYDYEITPEKEVNPGDVVYESDNITVKFEKISYNVSTAISDACKTAVFSVENKTEKDQTYVFRNGEDSTFRTISGRDILVLEQDVLHEELFDNYHLIVNKMNSAYEEDRTPENAEVAFKINQESERQEILFEDENLRVSFLGVSYSELDEIYKMSLLLTPIKQVYNFTVDNILFDDIQYVEQDEFYANFTKINGFNARLRANMDSHGLEGYNYFSITVPFANEGTITQSQSGTVKYNAYYQTEYEESSRIDIHFEIQLTPEKWDALYQPAK